MNKLTVGIIGGTGHMGKFFKRFFENNNCKVLVSSRKTKLSPENCARQCDVILISVPIESTVSVIKKISPYAKKGSLMIDTTSIKTSPVSAMLKYSKSEVIGMHPVFGPNTKSLKNQIIVLCPARTKKWIGWIIKIFEKNGARIKIATPEKHDQMMSIIQALIHFSALGIADVLKNSGVTLKETMEFASPIYRMNMLMIGRLLNQDANLYADIEIMNTKDRGLLKKYIDSVKKLQGIIESNDRKAFLKYFDECSGFFKEFSKESEEASEYLIEKMAEKKK